MKILEIKNFSVGYENGYVLNDISFSVFKGELLCILGRNGSGKTTLIKGIQKLIPNIKGEVYIEGIKINGLGPKQIARKVAYVPQLSDFIFQFTVKELIEMARYVHQGGIFKLTESDRKKINEAMEFTQIKEFQKRRIAHLSGGERKRVLIARALAQDTPLIFLDEPSAHLDLNFQIEIYRLLFNLCKEKGKTIVCTEHNINLVIPFCDRIIFLNNGGIFKEGKPNEIVNEENIKQVYNTTVKVRKNPETGLPEIYFIK
ncbi:ABC transporter ATP-binding protein [SCandidatus Aminicenantes bacterium Aminicenantia_JdfR_composite]|jgi:iron complex transport system ATP-binding protein|nr:ABC transporter ATP-binding protein [SCandidatus Aminicenantes bacterium Aminicenantia_JdfR_composite]MCP2620830.1 ABC transporter ATP-binding protein [Candidatus Aminicenantes bacterium AC-334-E05]